MRGAIVGFGNVAVEGHLPAWRQHRQFTIVAVCDADEARLAMAAELLPTVTHLRSRARVIVIVVDEPNGTAVRSLPGATVINVSSLDEFRAGWNAVRA